MSDAFHHLDRVQWLHTYFYLRSIFLLWWAGAKDAICVHRCVIFIVHDYKIGVKTLHCFALNGLVFLGSILLWTYALTPSILWLLQTSMAGWAGPATVNATYAALTSTFAVLWLLPVYIVSFTMSCVWYQEIAELAVGVVKRRLDRAPVSVPAQTGRQQQRQHHHQQQQDVMVLVAQEMYRVVLYAVYFAQVSAVSFLPFVGKPVYCVLVSWLYALYSFDYKWSLTSRRLEQRVQFFEQHWAFFLGFGSVCTLATIYWAFFTGAAIMAMVYPCFILVACDSDPRRAYQKVEAAERAAGRQLQVGSLPIFGLAIRTTTWLLQRGPSLVAIPAALMQHWRTALVVICAGIFLSASCLPILARGSP